MRIIKTFFLAATLMLSLSAVAQTIHGDTNGDGTVDIADVNATINMMLGKQTIDAAADINGDGTVDIADVNGVINIMLGKTQVEQDLPLGVYMGIIGFNDRLYTYPVSLLNIRTRGAFTEFINGLTTHNGTVLYWATENALAMLEQAPRPEQLSNVVLVTFTDGLDQGSMMYNSNYATNEEYAAALQQRICQTYKGLPLEAFSIGIRGSDVTDVTQFSNNLRQLASSDDNATQVTSMDAVNTRLNEIAQRLRLVTKKQDLSLTIPGQPNGTRVRFTFDSVSDAAYSTVFIEGTFNLADRSLRDVTYHGMHCSSGTTVAGMQDGIFVTYKFASTSYPSGEILSTDHIKQWSYVNSSGQWQHNSEFTPETDIEQTITNSSALVVLNLDCSSSLGSQFSTVQTHANNFVAEMACCGDECSPLVGHWEMVSVIENGQVYDLAIGEYEEYTFYDNGTGIYCNEFGTRVRFDWYEPSDQRVEMRFDDGITEVYNYEFEGDYLIFYETSSHRYGWVFRYVDEGS